MRPKAKYCFILYSLEAQKISYFSCCCILFDNVLHVTSFLMSLSLQKEKERKSAFLPNTL